MDKNTRCIFLLLTSILFGIVYICISQNKTCVLKEKYTSTSDQDKARAQAARDQSQARAQAARDQYRAQARQRNPKDLSELKKWSKSAVPTLLNKYCQSNSNLRKGQSCVADCSKFKGQKPFTTVGEKLIQDDNGFNWLKNGQTTSFPTTKYEYCKDV